MDKIISNLIKSEKKRQNETINLIASENYISSDVCSALGSVFTNKYAEGYSGRRYYSGNQFVDALEEEVKARALKLFKLSYNTWSVNVQPYSGSPANLATLFALVPLGDPNNLDNGRGKIMAMDLSMGGHLTHGFKVSVTGKLWQQIPYGVDQKTERIDYGLLMQIAKQEQPKIIIAGGSAYARKIDFKKMKIIADHVEALLMVDMAHIAGLVASGAHPSPFPYADVVTTTTHKTLRGPRGAMIFSKNDYAQKIDKAVFPAFQGGPHENAIAGIGVALFEAQKPEFKKYTQQVIKNASVLATELQKRNWRVVSGGTDTHLFLVDTASRGISGGIASDMLEEVGITVNKNTIPYDTRNPMDPSGIRIGTPAITTRGMQSKEMKQIAEWIANTLEEKINPLKTQKEIKKFLLKFPIR